MSPPLPVKNRVCVCTVYMCVHVHSLQACSDNTRSSHTGAENSALIASGFITPSAPAGVGDVAAAARGDINEPNTNHTNHTNHTPTATSAGRMISSSKKRGFVYLTLCASRIHACRHTHIQAAHTHTCIVSMPDMSNAPNARKCTTGSSATVAKIRRKVFAMIAGNRRHPAPGNNSSKRFKHACKTFAKCAGSRRHPGP